MVFLRSSALVLFCVVAVSGCGNGSDNLCRNVTCTGNRVCNPTTGACERLDGGDVVDAGTKDAGIPDAGPFDAGPMCPPGCAAAGQVCDPVTFTCVQCVSNAQCSCPSPICDVATHACVAALPDAGVFVQPIGESCADARLITFPTCSPNRTTFRVDLNALTDNEKGTCSAGSGLGRDAVFLLNVAAITDVKVSTAQVGGSTAQAVSYLRMSPCATGAELACRDSLGAPSNFRAKSVAPGVYALVIDAYDQLSSGLVEVTVEFLPAITNETCSAPLDVSTDGGTTNVDLSGATDDLSATCNTALDSRDAVYRVTIGQESDFHAVISPLIEDAGIDPVVYLRSSPCVGGTPLVCIDERVAEPEHLRARGLDAGTYFLVVEGRGSAGSGPVAITSWATPAVPFPPNDTCLAPRVLDFSIVNPVRFVVDNSEGEDDAVGSCAPFRGGRDVVYSFTLATTRTVTVRAESTDGGLDWDSVLYLRRGGCEADAGVQVDCADLGFEDPETMVNTLSAGTYFLFVDSYSASSAGPTIVTVTLSP